MAKQYSAPPAIAIDPNKTYTATIDTSEGKIVAELYPKEAPCHVNSFVFLAREGFYNGAIFHRVIPGFMIQGGDPTGTGTGGPGYNLKAEFNDTKPTPRALLGARSQSPAPAGSPLFLTHGGPPHLRNHHTAYGQAGGGP